VEEIKSKVRLGYLGEEKRGALFPIRLKSYVFDFVRFSINESLSHVCLIVLFYL